MVEMRHVLGDPAEKLIFGTLQYLVDNARAFRGVFLHLLELLRLEPARLPEDLIIDRDLAQIMHWRSLDHILTEFIVQIQLIVLPDPVDQHPDQITGTLNMSAGGVIATLDHCSHPQHEPVMHIHDVSRFLFYLFLQSLVILVDLPDVTLLLRIIHKEELISAWMSVIHQIADIHIVVTAVGLVRKLILDDAVFIFICEFGEPVQQRILESPVILDTCIHLDPGQIGQDLHGGLVTPHIVEPVIQ